MEDGARLATSMMSSMTARGTGLALKPRTLLRVLTSSSKSMLLPQKRRVGTRRLAHPTDFSATLKLAIDSLSPSRLVGSPRNTGSLTVGRGETGQRGLLPHPPDPRHC